ncbi:MAG: glycosyltransferase family 2 protein [Clostridia bacterium]|nr:glycosyltransferase family 2 protein [Clostridia bacterium]
MKAEILLAAYNGAGYLPELLSSLAEQTDPSFTVRYQDDGSTDGTAELLADWAERDRRFRAGREQGRHLGAKGNFLSLLRQSEGDLVFLCDQDDIWTPEKVETLIGVYRDAAERLPEGTPVLVHSDAVVVDADDRVLAESFFRLQGWDQEAVTLNRLLVQNNVTGCTALLNRPLVDLAVRFAQPERMFMHDWFIALTAASFGRVFFCPLQLTRYRQHGGNVLGASRESLYRRALKALRFRDRARERIELTYTHTQAFLEMVGKYLPPEAEEVIRDYLHTRSLPKWRRIAAWKRMGTLMQSPVTRLGQFFFG